MTPFQMARRFCDNYHPEGCGGMGFDIKDGKVVFFPLWTKKTKCILLEGNRRCRHFEECVMPIHIDDSQTHLKTQVAGAVAKYRLMANLGAAGDGRECPDCGQALEPRKKLCHVCARTRRLAAFRERRDRKAKAGV